MNKKRDYAKELEELNKKTESNWNKIFSFCSFCDLPNCDLPNNKETVDKKRRKERRALTKRPGS